MNPPTIKDGFVYFIRCEVPRCTNCGQQPERPIKVGYAYDVARRLNDLQIGNPFDLRLAYALPTAGMELTERTIHQHHLAAHHIRGEWFREDAAARLAAGFEAGTLITPDEDEQLRERARVRAARLRAPSIPRRIR